MAAGVVHCHYDFILLGPDGTADAQPIDATTDAQPTDAGDGGSTCPMGDGIAVRTATPPVIDGLVDGLWSAAPPYPIDQIVYGTVLDPADFSGTWRALWDSDHVYLLVEVADDILLSDSGVESWEDDTVEVFLDADCSGGQSYDNVNDFQYLFRWNDPVVNLGTYSVPNANGVTFAMEATATGYVLEVAIPWATLGVSPTRCMAICGEVQADDDDDGLVRDAQLGSYSSADDCFTNPSRFGRLVLE